METKPSNTMQWLLTCLVSFLFILIPLLYSGRTLESLLIMELVGVILLGLMGWFNLWQGNLNKTAIVLLVSFLAIPIIYLIPIPYEWWIELPGRLRYQESVEWLYQQGSTPTPYLAISIIPYKTAHALLAMLPLIAITLVVGSLTFSFRYKLVVLFLILASIQALIALVQFTNPNAEWLSWLAADTGRSSQGTYRNRDHLATFMIIALPMAIGLMIYSIGLKQSIDAGTQETKEWRITTTLFYLFVLLLILAGAVFTRSRAGILLTLLVLIITLPLFAPHMGGKKTLGITASILGLGGAILASIGLIPVLNRFILSNAAEDERWRMASITIKAIKEFFPIGTGPSTFQEIYRGFQPVDQLHFINHAHNDYLELILETGALGIAVLVLTLLVYIRGWVAMWDTRWDRERIIKTAAGVGILMFMLHASLEFTSHTPANALFLAFLAGLFLKLPNRAQLKNYS